MRSRKGGPTKRQPTGSIYFNRYRELIPSTRAFLAFAGAAIAVVLTSRLVTAARASRVDRAVRVVAVDKSVTVIVHTVGAIRFG